MSTTFQQTITVPEELETGHITFGITGADDYGGCGVSGVIYFSRSGNTLTMFAHKTYSGPAGYVGTTCVAWDGAKCKNYWPAFICTGCSATEFYLSCGGNDTSSLSISGSVQSNAAYTRPGGASLNGYTFNVPNAECYKSSSGGDTSSISVSVPAFGDYQITVSLITSRGTTTFTDQQYFGTLVTDTTRDVTAPIFVNVEDIIYPTQAAWLNVNGVIYQTSVYTSVNGEIKKIG